MNDDDLTELILRASAYLDGELDAAETARAEADPAVMAEVEQLRALQADVRFVDPPTDAARESAIAAALAEFDALHAPTARPAGSPSPSPSPAVVPFRPRPAYARWLTAAAAVVVVGLLGVVVANGLGGGDDESQSAVLDASATTFDGDSSRVVAEATAESAFVEESAVADAAPEGGDAAIEAAPSATEAPQVFASTEESGTESDEASASASELAPATTSTASPFPPFDAERPIGSELELGAAGAELLAREAAGTLGATPETRCELDPYDELSFGRYQVGDDVRDVLVAVDRTTLRTAAFDADTCEIVVLSPAP